MSSAIYRFGGFRLDPAGRVLCRGDDELTLPLKIFDCIVYLLEHRDRAVGRDELIAAVWGTAHLSDSALGQSILLARKALDDTGEEQHVIKTVRGFGYRWVAPVELEVAAASNVPAVPTHGVSQRAWRFGWALAVVLIAGVAVSWRYGGGRDPEPLARSSMAGEVALLLPVRAKQAQDHAWIRLGVMDLIADRLRAAGQTMVPSDTVIALLRGVDEAPGPDEVARLSAATGARLVIDVQAQATGARWTVALHSLLGAQPPLVAVGESHDVLDAARLAADRLAAALGLTPEADSPVDPDLQRLLQQIRAARLAQQMDVARALIEQAEPQARRHPDVRFLHSTIEYYSHDLDAAQAILEPLLDEIPAQRDPTLRARVLNGLAVVHGRRNLWDRAIPLLEEGAQLLAGQENSAVLGQILTNLAGAALERGDVDAAWDHVAQARRIFEVIGDVRNLANVDLLLGVLEARRERMVEALHYFHSAAERYAIVNDVGSELHAQTYVMTSHLMLLDPVAAAAVEPRLNQLLAASRSVILDAIARLSLSDLLEDGGRLAAARLLLDDVLLASDTHKDLHLQRLGALARVAERAARDGDARTAARIAGEIVDQIQRYPDRKHDDTFGRAWLTLARAHLANGDVPAAAAVSAAMTDWAGSGSPYLPQIRAALAQAELAIAQDEPESAESAFERALGHAEASRVPSHLLEVVQRYVAWLLDGHRDTARALGLVDRIARHADRHFEVALLQLRVYHATQSLPAWRMALDRARSLAGERPIPVDLLAAPGRRDAASENERIRQAAAPVLQ